MYSLHMLMKVIRYVVLYTVHEIGFCRFTLYRNHFTERTDCAIPELFISTLIRNKCISKVFNLSYKET